MAFKLRSPAFGPGGEIPLKYTGDGADISPPLRWTGPPEGTKSFALTVDDREDPPESGSSGSSMEWPRRRGNSLKVSRGRTPWLASDARA